jgi:hypothetical protein
MGSVDEVGTTVSGEGVSDASRRGLLRRAGIGVVGPPSLDTSGEGAGTSSPLSWSSGRATVSAPGDHRAGVLSLGGVGHDMPLSGEGASSSGARVDTSGSRGSRPGPGASGSECGSVDDMCSRSLKTCRGMEWLEDEALHRPASREVLRRSGHHAVPHLPRHVSNG